MTIRQVRRLGEYVEQRGGLYRRRRDRQPVTAGTIIASLPQRYLRGPATIWPTLDGYEQIYTFATWKKGTQTLLLIREPDEEPNNPATYVDPYDDPHLDSLISAPKSVLVACYRATCGVCTREELVETTSQKKAAAILQDHGWHNTTIRGWVCTDHYYRDWKGSRSVRAKRRRAAEAEAAAAGHND